MTPSFGDSRVKQLDVTVTTTAAALSSSSLRVRAANLIAPGSNTNDVSVGPDSDADAKEIAAGGESQISARGVFDLKDWYAKTSSGSEDLKIVYLPAF